MGLGGLKLHYVRSRNSDHYNAGMVLLSTGHHPCFNTLTDRRRVHLIQWARDTLRGQCPWKRRG